MDKLCKHCSVVLTIDNKVHKRMVCKPCRSKSVCEYQKKSPERRRKYANEYARKVGLVKEYPCETCKEPCYKKTKNAYCSLKCRFLFYVKKTESCWIWMGGKGRSNYGKFMIGEKTSVASRVAYELFKGKLEENKYVCHTCDNPPCVNPEHLWLGTSSENQLDSIKKGRRKLKESYGAQ